MTTKTQTIFIGDTPLKLPAQAAQGEYITWHGELYYKIRNVDAMPPFFMSIVSSSNHWLFVASTGRLTAGGISTKQTLFPYYTDDKITENSENTGPKSILLVTRSRRTKL